MGAVVLIDDERGIGWDFRDIRHDEFVSANRRDGEIQPGESRHEPDLGALAVALGALGGRVNFVHGGIDRIQGHAQGRLVVSAEVRANADGTVQKQIATLLERARHYANHVEVLGYV